MGGKGSGGKPRQFIPAADREPFDRQPEESDKAFEAFVAYREMGASRTIAVVTKNLGKKVGVCDRWSRELGWGYRASEWDRAEDRHHREASLQAAEDKAREKVMVADLMWETAAEALMLWNQKLEEQTQYIQDNPDAPLPTPCMSPNHARQLAEAGLKLSQLLQGKPTEIGEQRRQITIDDRRKAIRGIIGDVRVRDAMKVVAEVAEENTDNGSGNGAADNDQSGPAVH